MATIFEDNFNSYNDGNLNGQGGWSGHTGFQVQGTVVKEGAKGMIADMASGQDWAWITKIGTARADGRITF